MSLSNQAESSSSKYIPTEESAILSARRRDSDPRASSSSPNYGALITHEEPTTGLPSHTWRQNKLYRYTTILVLLIATIALPVVLWFAPTLAERSIEGVVFTIQKAAILNVTDDSIMTMHIVGDIQLDQSSYKLYQKASYLTGSVSVHESQLTVLYPVNNTTLKMGSIELPALVLDTQSPTTGFDFVTQFMIEDNNDALVQFCKQAVMNTVVFWKMDGLLNLSLGWIPYRAQLRMSKTVSLQGMGGLNKTDMESMQFPGTHPLGGIQVEGRVGLMNPSKVLSFHLGDIDFGIYLLGEQEVEIAVVRAEDAELQGNTMNYFNVTGRTIPIDENDPVAKLMMETFLTKYLHGNVTRVSVRGSEKGPDGLEGETPSWLRRALADISIEVPFPGATNTDMIESLSLTHIQIDFSSSGHPLISGDALALLKEPEEMLFHMDIETIRPHVFLYLDANSTSPFGSVQPPRPARARTEDIEENKMKVTCRLSRAPFIVLPGGQKDYEEFMYRVLHRKRSKIYMRGTSEATIQSPFGRLTIQDLQFRGEIETQGLQGMNNPGPKVTSFSLLKGYPDALHSQTTLDIFSPSDIHINLGEVTMMLLYNGKIIGNTTITELLLAPGVHNSLTASTWLYGHSFEDRSALIRFIGKYISNVFATDLLTISGDHSNVSTSSYLNKFLRQLKFEVLPPVFDKEPLLADVKMNILSSSVIMSLRNPFDGIMMTIMKINATAYHEVYNIGTMTADFTQKGSGWKGPLILPPPSCEIQCQSNIIQSEKIPIETKKMGLDVIKKALGGSIDVSVDSVVEVKLDEFTLPSLVYHQNNITAKVRKGF